MTNSEIRAKLRVSRKEKDMAMFEIGDVVLGANSSCTCTATLTYLGPTEFGYIVNSCGRYDHKALYYQYPNSWLKYLIFVEDSFTTYVKDIRRVENL